MDKENIVGAVIMVLCCLLCAGSFTGIGIWAAKATKPVHFWSGTQVSPEKVADVKGYNRANARMWKLYAMPYWVSTALSVLGFWGKAYIIAAAVLLSLACVPGVLFLVWRYRAIERRYVRS